MTINPKFKTAKFLEKFDCYQTPALRLCYQNLIRPRAGKDDNGNPTTPKYDFTALIHKDADLDLIMDAAEELAKSKVGAKNYQFLRYPWRDIGEKTKSAAGIREALEAEGTLRDYTHFMSARSEDKPDIVHPSNRPFDPSEATDELYAGRWFRSTTRMYYYKKSGNEGIALALRNVQLLDHGERLKLGRVAAKAAEEFEAASDEEDDMPEERSSRRRVRDEDDTPFEGGRPARRQSLRNL